MRSCTAAPLESLTATGALNEPRTTMVLAMGSVAPVPENSACAVPKET
jgi:hypothetical protein